jgi:uncharacterized protein (TIGR03435 family)
MHFEVVSIRPSRAEGFSRNFNPTPDGYRVRGQTIGDMIAFAYYPLAARYWQGNLFKQTPAGLDDKYDIDAKISEKDLAIWQSQGPEVPLLRAALREMLEDRCKLKLHMESGHRVSVLELVVSKTKPKALKPFDPSEVIPSGTRQFSPYPAKLIPGPSPNAFYNTSMQALAYFLTGFGPPVFDATGLVGTYDFQLARDAPTPETANDPGSPARLHVEDLGLGLRTASREMPSMVIDHYEKPSPN